jgi:hypothetical protein
MTKQSLLTAIELERKYGVAKQNIKKMMDRHGFRSYAGSKYKEDEFLRARKAGAEMDKSAEKRNLRAGGGSTETIDDVPGDTTAIKLTKRKIKLADIAIQRAQHDLDTVRGLVISKADYQKRTAGMATICLGIIDQWIDNISAKRADAGLLDDLRKCRDAALSEIQAIRPDEG